MSARKLHRLASIFVLCAVGAPLAFVRADDPAPADGAPAPAPAFTTISDGLRIDAAAGIVEFDAKVSPMILSGAHGRDEFLLEQFVCTAGTKDHESLVVTTVKPSAIHAALLAAGAAPGKPVTWVNEGDQTKVVPPSGTALHIEFFIGDQPAVDPRSWVTDTKTKEVLTGGGWVFAGSTEKMSRGTPFYEADAAGTLIGLAGFGSETIAWTTPISDQEEEGELHWIANRAALPAGDTPVKVRISIEKPAE